jgi:hypothetical protein
VLCSGGYFFLNFVAAPIVDHNVRLPRNDDDDDDDDDDGQRRDGRGLSVRRMISIPSERTSKKRIHITNAAVRPLRRTIIRFASLATTTANDDNKE